ncbi:DUF427 domain-containing protein [soil metagenome]
MAEPERIEPASGQESVWDYPRPPRLERTSERLVVRLGEVTIADTTAAWRVLETSQPPAYYLPPGDVAVQHLTRTTHQTFCEWKGLARYFTVVAGDRQATDGAWSYPGPTPAFEPITDHLAFYAQLFECSVDGERVEPNEGSFYGGWVTSKVVGPFKGGPGTAHW